MYTMFSKHAGTVPHSTVQYSNVCTLCLANMPELYSTVQQSFVCIWWGAKYANRFLSHSTSTHNRYLVLQEINNVFSNISHHFSPANMYYKPKKLFTFQVRNPTISSTLLIK